MSDNRIISSAGQYGSTSNTGIQARRSVEVAGGHASVRRQEQAVRPVTTDHGVAGPADPGDVTSSNFRKKKRLAVFIVTLTLFLDLCLMTALVPIAPAYLDISANETGAYTKLGILFSSNAGVQLLTNIVLGPLIDKFGSSGPLFGGVLAMTLSTIAFAFAGDISWTHRYAIVLGARTLQGISSACAATGGMAWLATLFPTDEERGEAMGTAMSGLGLGVLVGPPMGAAFTKFGVDAGWKYPFLILAFLCVVDAFLQMLLVWSPLPTYTADDAESEKISPTRALKQLATDPYIIFTFTVSFFGNTVMAVLEASFPQLLSSTFGTSGWVLGAIFIPCMLPYVLIAPISGKYLARFGRQWGLMFGGISLVIGMVTIPFVADALKQHHLSVWILSACLSFCGLGLGVMDSSVMTYMADVVQKRHSSLFGSSCAIVDGSVSLAFFMGPLVSNFLIDKLQFKWVYVGLGCLLLMFLPGVYFLHQLPNNQTGPESGDTEEREPLLSPDLNPGGLANASIQD
ncbi:chromaffin granule amine transporter-like [Sycon ciliatum]|uniref:chromaffin granule amine transporter-like n=1 Tax=Sycon ciliatum TaxID=27933 RepID=UPI0020A855C4|eukprot:scpid56605/ scgid22609/ Probable vesicular acetylcholine transporter-B; Solute carrier family 18 member 3-B